MTIPQALRFQNGKTQGLKYSQENLQKKLESQTLKATK
jgi:hypothetical protein